MAPTFTVTIEMALDHELLVSGIGARLTGSASRCSGTAEATPAASSTRPSAG